MDFGIGFISTNIMLPILDFFYGIVPSYGFGIIALTLVVRFAVYPLSAGQIRNMRKMRITQPLMKQRQEEVQKRYKDDPKRQQEEMAKIMQEFGNPLAGCLPLLLQMPILFALFATLRGSPFSDINYTVDVQIFPQEQIERIAPQPYSTKTQNVFITDGKHSKITAILPTGNKLTVGESEKVELQTIEGKSLQDLNNQYPDTNIQPRWSVTKGEERVTVNENGEITALGVGDATIQITIPGIAADKGFLFIKALGRVGATSADGSINWDIVGMIIFFGLSIYLNQELSGTGQKTGGNDQQQSVNKITPVIFSGMFLFFPLPAGVLMYIVLANVFQTIQTLILTREPLPENIQKILDEQEKAARGREEIPFEKKNLKKKEKTS
ncbi:MAG: membrane protein insertase YidC [Cyanobacteria bacterium]|nr:membrane protein insertase YidC [Cyanobacteria bacterium CG_2015-16_32_12]NCO77816.1 membrane protein insertase YidC [Cyanobacteria bacterium CG_2015-22_32_23]NCQ05019.1 membrane protein insertase YidC [Cyanobacteria bacterium CG_2015-09_32_10]NCQ43109.1 membrane protein insertase YidC [Cyanobacteria bacterium CG_2015-04_32_10]NCS86197.1 membrane protein insertase YidC [Cyanobacteria bacterium CG_2015-02_32_10]